MDEETTFCDECEFVDLNTNQCGSCPHNPCTIVEQTLEPFIERQLVRSWV